MKCDGKIVLVAGAGSGIGRATAKLFANYGATVVVAAHDITKAQAVTQAIKADGGVAMATSFDITDIEDCRRVTRETLDEYGRIDILSNSVGWAAGSFFMDESADQWRKVIDVNLMGPIYIARSVLENMIERMSGSIVFTSSDNAKVGTMGEVAYSAAKGGVVTLSKSLAREMARYGIRVNTVAPGPTDTALFQRVSRTDEKILSRIVRSTPLKRTAQPEEVANAIVFLASDAASFITGQTLSVSGGLTMC
jgi:NAD(P)-dependent dehydrogenase (short-subunit alcohol dehydrogenase family)